jgi:hypothetical protein
MGNDRANSVFTITCNGLRGSRSHGVTWASSLAARPLSLRGRCLPDERFKGDRKESVQFTDHVEREGAFAAEDLGDPSRRSEDLEQILAGEALLFHSKLDGTHRIETR